MGRPLISKSKPLQILNSEAIIRPWTDGAPLFCRSALLESLNSDCGPRTRLILKSEHLQILNSEGGALD